MAADVADDSAGRQVVAQEFDPGAATNGHGRVPEPAHLAVHEPAHRGLVDACAWMAYSALTSAAGSVGRLAEGRESIVHLAVGKVGGYGYGPAGAIAGLSLEAGLGPSAVMVLISHAAAG